MMRMYYFAYGSNMDAARMRKRQVAFTERRPAVLSGYHMEFNKVAADDPRKGFTSLVDDIDGTVEGVLYEIDAVDFTKLDKYEGYPEHYVKIPVRVRVRDTQCEVCALAFVARPEHIRQNLKPRRVYLDHLLAGRDVLSREYCARLEKIETLD